MRLVITVRSRFLNPLGRVLNKEPMKTLIMLLCLALCIGCADIIKQDAAQTVLLGAASRTLGYKLTQNDPEFAAPAKVFINSLIVGNIDQALFDAVKLFLTQKCSNDPLLAANLADLVKLVQVNGVYNTTFIKIAATGMLEGITLAEVTKTAPALH
jgi:hypothetical protein